jgi:hypothetical protein
MVRRFKNVVEDEEQFERKSGNTSAPKPLVSGATSSFSSPRPRATARLCPGCRAPGVTDA